MAKLPHMKFFVGDYELKTRHLSLEEDGAYMRLLRLCWKTAGGTIPADQNWVRRYMCVDEATFERSVLPVLNEFFDIVDGRYVNARLKDEYDAAFSKVSAARDSGSKGGKAKALKANEKTPSERQKSATAKPKQSPTERQPAATPSATQKPKRNPTYPEPEPEPEPEKNLYTLPPLAEGPAREPEPEQDRSADASLGGRVDPLFEDLVGQVFQIAGFLPERRSGKTDAMIARWADALPSATILQVVRERTAAMVNSGDPPRGLKAFEDGIGRAIEARRATNVHQLDVNELVRSTLKRMGDAQC